MFGIAKETFLRTTVQFLDAMLAKVPEVIRWPNENELNLYAAEDNTIGTTVLLNKAIVLNSLLPFVVICL